MEHSDHRPTGSRSEEEPPSSRRAGGEHHSPDSSRQLRAASRSATVSAGMISHMPYHILYTTYRVHMYCILCTVSISIALTNTTSQPLRRLPAPGQLLRPRHQCHRPPVLAHRRSDRLCQRRKPEETLRRYHCHWRPHQGRYYAL